MFTSPEWIWLEIIVIISIIAFFGALIGRYIYKKVHHIPTGDCACCKANKNKILKEYHKKYAKK